jgi:glutathione synthase/RimK-type ligase-like ATP-grasp enzyme
VLNDVPMRICFVTCNDEPLLTMDDQLLTQFLLTKNIITEAAIWDEEEVAWQQFDVIVLRSMWDYHTKADKFIAWLNRLDLFGYKVLNPVSAVKWNLNKRYLADISKQGVLLPPLQFCAQNSVDSLQVIMKTNCWEKAVVKPAVSGGSFNTWTTTALSAANDNALFKKMLGEGDVIVQKYMDEITTKGELSLMFFNKKFSHAVLKRAKAGDFRIQAKFGGTVEVLEPNESILNYASAIIDTIDEPLLYARVDGIVGNDGKFYLMELELIEPALFIGSSTAACANFYEALDNLLSLSKNQVAAI